MLAIVELVAFPKEAEGLCELAGEVLGSSDLVIYQFCIPVLVFFSL